MTSSDGGRSCPVCTASLAPDATLCPACPARRGWRTRGRDADAAAIRRRAWPFTGAVACGAVMLLLAPMADPAYAAPPLLFGPALILAGGVGVALALVWAARETRWRRPERIGSTTDMETNR